MTARLVFDTGPLSAFTREGRLDILQHRYTGRAVWTVEVRAELSRGVARVSELQDVLDADWLGEPVRMTDPAELQEVERVRWALGGTPSQPLRHLGEAATIVLARRLGSVAVLDDRDARRFAAVIGVQVGTIGILRGCVRDGALTADETWGLLQSMIGKGFRAPPISRPWFGPWVTSYRSCK